LQPAGRCRCPQTGKTDHRKSVMLAYDRVSTKQAAVAAKEGAMGPEVDAARQTATGEYYRS